MGSPGIAPCRSTRTQRIAHAGSCWVADLGNSQVVRLAVVVPISCQFCDPIDPDGSNVFKAGRTVPVKIILTDEAGDPIRDAICHLSSSQVSQQVLGSVPESPDAGKADAGDIFRYDEAEDHYVHNLSTKGMAPGRWELRVTVEGYASFEATVMIGLR